MATYENLRTVCVDSDWFAECFRNGICMRQWGKDEASAIVTLWKTLVALDGGSSSNPHSAKIEIGQGATIFRDGPIRISQDGGPTNIPKEDEEIQVPDIGDL